MKEQALIIANGVVNPNEKLNVLREYLQAFVLRSLHESEAFVSLSFVGGTALRFLYGLPRFSEDLDFTLEKSGKYQPHAWLKKLKQDLKFANFEASITWNERKTVHTGWVRVAGLLREVGLSGHAAQTLSIKMEVDTIPPKGAVLAREVVNKYFLLALQHHDLPSLMAGKIHAICCRKYTKGRDWYDLFWYRSQHPPVEPNLHLLQRAIDQTEADPWPAEAWKTQVSERLAAMDWKRLIQDVAPFLERPDEKAFLTPEFFAKMLR